LDHPTGNWSYTLPTAIDVDHDPTFLEVTLDAKKIYYDPSSQTLIQFGFYSEPRNESVSIVLSDDHGH
jgi:hypothetical protein